MIDMILHFDALIPSLDHIFVHFLHIGKERTNPLAIIPNKFEDVGMIKVSAAEKPNISQDLSIRRARADMTTDKAGLITLFTPTTIVMSDFANFGTVAAR
jgi:hypothetical protein